MVFIPPSKHLRCEVISVLLRVFHRLAAGFVAKLVWYRYLLESLLVGVSFLRILYVLLLLTHSFCCLYWLLHFDGGVVLLVHHVRLVLNLLLLEQLYILCIYGNLVVLYHIVQLELPLYFKFKRLQQVLPISQRQLCIFLMTMPIWLLVRF
jgi:hypothetical protein